MEAIVYNCNFAQIDENVEMKETQSLFSLKLKLARVSIRITFTLLQTEWTISIIVFNYTAISGYPLPNHRFYHVKPTTAGFRIESYTSMRFFLSSLKENRRFSWPGGNICLGCLPQHHSIQKTPVSLPKKLRYKQVG